MTKKIAHICTSRNSYKMLEEKLRLLQLKGYEVHLISSEEGEDSGFFRDRGIRQHFLEMPRSIKPLRDLRALGALIKLLKREKFDIVHTHTAKAGFLGRIAARLAGTPLVVHTAHGLPFYQGQGRAEYLFYKFLETLAARFCHHVGTQNYEDFRILSRFIESGKLYYEGNGINLTALNQGADAVSRETVAKLRMFWGIPLPSKIILAGARFEPVKDHFLLLEALALLKGQGVDPFCCLLAGQGPLEKELRFKAIKLGLEKEIKFIGYQTDIIPWIKLADLIVLSSRKEGIPRIIMESMALGKAIAATDVPGTRELVVPGLTGLLSSYGDPGGLALNIALLLKDDLIRKKFGIAGRRRIEDCFQEEQVLERIIKIYDRVSQVSISPQLS